MLRKEQKFKYYLLFESFISYEVIFASFPSKLKLKNEFESFCRKEETVYVTTVDSKVFLKKYVLKKLHGKLPWRSLWVARWKQLNSCTSGHS